MKSKAYVKGRGRDYCLQKECFMVKHKRKEKWLKRGVFIDLRVGRCGSYCQWLLLFLIK